MSEQHTPGPVKAKGSDLMMGRYRLANVYQAASLPMGLDMERARANAARLAACWNACEGIADPEQLRAQRDALLEALRGAHGALQTIANHKGDSGCMSAVCGIAQKQADKVFAAINAATCPPAPPA